MRLRIILKFKFNTKNKITATGELAVPLPRYSFDIIGDKKKYRKFTEKLKKILTMCKKHNPEPDRDRLYETRQTMYVQRNIVAHL